MASLQDIENALKIVEASIAQDNAALAADPKNAQLQQRLAQDLNLLQSLNLQWAAARMTPEVSVGAVASDEQVATVEGARPQAPNPAPQILSGDGRIQAAPLNNSGSTALSPVSGISIAGPVPAVIADSGLDAAVRPLVSTQAVPPAPPGLLLNPGPNSITILGSSGDGRVQSVLPPNITPGVGAPPDDSTAAADTTLPNTNQTRQEINSIFNNAPIIPQANILDGYATYNYGISVYLTSSDAYQAMLNSGVRNLSGSHLLFQSAGIPVGSRTPYFGSDYYIDKLDIHSRIMGRATGMTHNVVDFTMTVVEPNSISLIDNLTRAVQTLLPEQTKKKNLAAVIYIMVIRFYGFDQYGNLVRGAPAAGTNSIGQSTDTNAFVEKYFPFQIEDIKFKVAGKAVEYDMKCKGLHYAINVSTARGTVPYNLELSGQTVNDLLNGPAQFATAAVAPGTAPAKADAAPTVKGTVRQGLIQAMNDYQASLAGPGKQYEYPDVYSIEFAIPSLQNAKVRKAGTLNRAATSNSTGQTAADQKLGVRQSVDPNSRIQSVTAGQQMVQIIDQIIRNSTYLEDQQLVKYDEDGTLIANGTPAQNVAWFKIDLLATPGPYDSKRNDFSYNIKYTVRPYRIAQLNSQYFATPTFTGVVKQYNYWFTGQNTSVLSYEENINHLYYLTLSGVNLNTGSATLGDQGEQIKYSFNTRSVESSQGADGKTNEPVANAAEQLLNPADFKNATITIVGDPAWIQQGEVFMGTPIGSSDYFSAFLADGTINVDTGQPLYRVTFNASGDYDLATGLQTITGTTLGTAGLSGSSDPGAPVNTGPTGPGAINRTFIAQECISSFNKGKFTQQLKGSLVLSLTTADNQTAAAQQKALQTAAISALSPNRQGSVVAAASAVPWDLSASALLQAQPLTGLSTLGQNALGGQATRLLSLVAGPATSLGQAVGSTASGLFGSPPTLPQAVVNAPAVVPDAGGFTDSLGIWHPGQTSSPPEVDSVSTGAVQMAAASDDSSSLQEAAPT